MGLTAKGERRLEIQDIARCKIAHVATDQEIAKKKNPGRKPGPTKRKARARKERKTKQLSPTAQPFISTTSQQARDINTASAPEPTKREEPTPSEDAGLPSSTPANPGFAGDHRGNEGRQHGYSTKRNIMTHSDKDNQCTYPDIQRSGGCSDNVRIRIFPPKARLRDHATLHRMLQNFVMIL